MVKDLLDLFVGQSRSTRDRDGELLRQKVAGGVCVRIYKKVGAGLSPELYDPAVRERMSAPAGDLKEYIILGGKFGVFRRDEPGVGENIDFARYYRRMVGARFYRLDYRFSVYHDILSAGCKRVPGNIGYPSCGNMRDLSADQYIYPPMPHSQFRVTFCFGNHTLDRGEADVVGYSERSVASDGTPADKLHRKQFTV